MSTQILTRAWWQAAGARAANTALAGAAAYVLQVFAGQATPLYAVSATAMIAVASIVTSLGGLAEVDGKSIPLWKAILTRVAKTAGQSLVVWFGASTLFSQLDVHTLGVMVGGPVLVTILRTLKQYLPETDPQVVADATQVAAVTSSMATTVSGVSPQSSVTINTSSLK